MQTSEDSTGVTTYTFDGAGNQQTVEAPSGDVTTYTWDFENQNTQIEQPTGDLFTYTYNADKLRASSEDETGTTTKFVWDANNVLIETDDSDVTQVRYTLVPEEYGKLVSESRDDGGGFDSSFHHFDGLGSVDRLTDSSEVVSDEYTYEAFGKTTHASGTSDNPHDYRGEVGYYHDLALEPALAHHYLRARTYGDDQGRFLSEDPVRDDEGDLYRYAGNDPVNEVDPSGLEIRYKIDPDPRRSGDRLVYQHKQVSGWLPWTWNNLAILPVGILDKSGKVHRNMWIRERGVLVPQAAQSRTYKEVKDAGDFSEGQQNEHNNLVSTEQDWDDFFRRRGKFALETLSPEEHQEAQQNAFASVGPLALAMGSHVLRQLALEAAGAYGPGVFLKVVKVGGGLVVKTRTGRRVAEWSAEKLDDLRRKTRRTEESLDSTAEQLEHYLNAPRVGLSKARQIAGYADDDLASLALKHRKANKLRRKGNVAVVEYEVNGVTKIEAFDTVGKGRKHSEFVAKGQSPEGAKVKRLFTERQSCQLQIPNCDRMLARDFADAEITYLVEWGDTKASRTRGNQLLDALLRNEGL